MNPHRSFWPILIASFAFAVADGGCAHTTTNQTVALTPGQERVLAKLKQITLPEFSCDGFPLDDLVNVILTKDARKFDPEKQGIAFRFDTAAKPGQPSGDKDYLDTTIIKLMLPLRNVRLLDALDVTARSADKPIQFTIGENGVMWSRRLPGVALKDWSTGAAAVQVKLSEIVFPQTHFDGLPLNEVLKMLDGDARRLDKAKQGVNIIATSFYPDPPANVVRPPVLDAAGKPIQFPLGTDFGPVFDMDIVIVNLKLGPSGTRMKDVLDAIVRAADHPIQYKLEDYGVVFMPKFIGKAR